MKIKCDFCDATANMSKDNLIANGWNWAIPTNLILKYETRTPIYACPIHQNNFEEQVMKQDQIAYIAMLCQRHEEDPLMKIINKLR